MQVDFSGSDGDSRTADALRAAHQYCIQNQKLDAIAVELTISRSSVSRLIAFARDCGLVEIRLHSPIDQLTRLQHQLHDRFGLTTHIVPAGDAATEVDRLERSALSAARILSDFVDSTMGHGAPARGNGLSPGNIFEAGALDRMK